MASSDDKAVVGPVRLLVTGGRDYNDEQYFNAILNDIRFRYGISEILHGACPTGADKLADNWACATRTPMKTFRALWSSLGRAAGPIRNQRMVDDKPTYAVAFPGGRGTADCVTRIKAAGIPLDDLREVAQSMAQPEEAKKIDYSQVVGL